MKKVFGWKMFNATLIIISIFVYTGIEIYWQNKCVGGGCSLSFVEGILEPLKIICAFFVINFSLFLFFPPIYFRSYIKRWFWWLFILGYTIVAATKPVGSSIGALNRTQVVVGLGALGLGLTILFIYRFHRRQKASKS